MRRKLRMLAWCDSPLSITGFGVVAKNILGRIYKTGMFDLACVGINHFEEHFDHAFEDRSEVPYKVFIGQDVVRQGNSIQTFDPMGRAKTLQMLKSGQIDVFFCMRDLWDMVFQQAQGRPHLESYMPLHIQLAKEHGANFRVLSHFPLEYQVQGNWVPALDMMDYGYCFTAGGMPQLEKWSDKIAWCPQGADVDTFKPLENFNKDLFKQQRMRLDPNTFVVLCVQRNQPRKDIPATIQAFAKFKQMLGNQPGGKRPVLWLHMRPDDNFGDARDWVREAGLRCDHDVYFPPNFNVGSGWSEQELNALYNAADVFISTSVAEGFGLCVTPDTQIDTHNGTKPMRDVVPGDMVLTEDGQYHEVKQKVQREVETIFEVVSAGDEKTRVTAEHPFYTLRLSKFPVDHSEHHNTQQPKWRRADELRVGDFIGTPVPQLPEMKCGTINWANYHSDAQVHAGRTISLPHGYSPKTGVLKEYPQFLKLLGSERRVMEFFGWYIAEGSSPNGRTLEFSLGEEDGDRPVQLIRGVMSEILGMEVSVNKKDKRVQIIGCSSIHSRAFKKLFGDSAENKKIPTIFYCRPEPRLVGPMLRGLFLGDGSIKDQSIVLHSKSRCLIGQVRTMLMSVRIPSCISRDKRTGVYDLTICRQGYDKFAELCGEDLVPEIDKTTDRDARRFFFRNAMAFSRIRSIEEVEYNDTVMDIEVRGVHSFVGNGILLHNTPVEAGCAGCPVLVTGHTGHLQTIQHLGMPYVKGLPMELREKVSPSPVTPTDTDDMAAKLAAHYADPTVLQGLVKKNLKSFRHMFSWDTIFNDYWLPVLETIQEDIFGTEARQKANKGRVLFVCEEAAGDIAAGASRAISGLKQQFPNTPIDFMCKPQFANILKGMPEIDKHIPWDINKIYDYEGGVFDPVQNPNGRCFYPHSRIRHGNWSSGWSHLMDMQAEMIGVEPGNPYLNVEEFDPMLDSMDGAVPDLITIHTTSQGGKMIAPDKWATIVRGILEKHPDMRFAVVGGPNDMMIPGAMDFRGLPFEQQAWLQKISFCHIGIDSSPMHFAEIVGQPSITFWGWTNPEVCKARKGGIHIVAFHPTVCPRLGPCHGVQPICGINQYEVKSAMQAPCVQSINVQPAIDMVNRALDMGREEGRQWLWDKGTGSNNIYSYPQVDIEAKPQNRLKLAGVK